MLRYVLFITLGLISFNAFAGRVTCSSFSTQAEAQAYYIKYNAYWLDRDRDGEACECLYGGSKYGSKSCRH
ncbi:TPA: excalibur calcium-binding domain-containing protein [Neisseria subflava]